MATGYAAGGRLFDAPALNHILAKKQVFLRIFSQEVDICLYGAVVHTAIAYSVVAVRGYVADSDTA